MPSITIEKLIYYCTITSCRQQFATPRGLISHMHHIHPHTKYALCPLAEQGCGFVADAQEHAKQHYLAVHLNRRPKINCPLASEGCQFTSDSHEQIKQHYLAVHGNPSFSSSSSARHFEIPSLHNLVHDARPPPSSALSALIDNPSPSCRPGARNVVPAPSASSARKPINVRKYAGPLEIQFRP